MTMDEPKKISITVDKTLMEMETSLKRVIAENDALKSTIKKHREAVKRFLIPHAPHLSECWIEHFIEEGMVEFDGLSFKVKPLEETKEAR